MQPLKLKKLQRTHGGAYEFEVPSSKSIFNRVVLLAALSDKTVAVKHGYLGEDSLAMLGCLNALGIESEDRDGVLLVHGCHGNIPVKDAALDVMSAGTAARFLPAVLAVAGGNYTLTASPQMQRRPMEYLTQLEEAGAEITYLAEQLHYPFRISSSGRVNGEFRVNTDESTQYASALLISSLVSRKSTHIILTGNRTRGSYIQMTLSLMKEFGVDFQREQDEITVFPKVVAPDCFDVEGDLSAACYFFAAALILRCKVTVKRVRADGVQGDVKFLKLLEERGVLFTQTNEGLTADATNVASFAGFEENFCDFSDQTLTAAAIAPFASTPSRLYGIGHIRGQECDRIAAIVKNLTALGVPVREEKDCVEITPAPVKSGRITTFHDHRVAMAFALPALMTGGIIDEPTCCNKTFPEYFTELKKLYASPL